MKKQTTALIPLACFVLACAADAGPDGRDSLLVTSEEPAGDNCSAGGLRVDTGLDTNGNGELDESEQRAPSFVCASATAPPSDAADLDDGGAALNDAAGSTADDAAVGYVLTSSQPDATECADGGTKIELRDTAGTVVGDPVLVCAQAGVSFGDTPVVKAQRPAAAVGDVAQEGDEGTIMVLDATIVVPQAGFVIATGQSAAYCARSPGDLATCASPEGTTVSLIIVDATAPGATSGDATELTGMPVGDVQIGTSAVFPVDQPGSYTYQLLAMASDSTPDAPDTSVYFGGSELTLMFVPRS